MSQRVDSLRELIITPKKYLNSPKNRPIHCAEVGLAQSTACASLKGNTIFI